MRDHGHRKRLRETDNALNDEGASVSPSDVRPVKNAVSMTPYGSNGTPAARKGNANVQSRSNSGACGDQLPTFGAGRPSTDYRTPSRVILGTDSSVQGTAKADRGTQGVTSSGPTGPKPRPSSVFATPTHVAHSAGGINALKEVPPLALLREELRLFDLELHVRHRARVYRHHRWYSWSNKVWGLFQRIFFPLPQSKAKVNCRNSVGGGGSTSRVANATPAAQKVKPAGTPSSGLGASFSTTPLNAGFRASVSDSTETSEKPKKVKLSSDQLLRRIEHACMLVAAELRLQRLDTIPICIALFSTLARLHYWVSVVKIPLGPIPKKEDLQSQTTGASPSNPGGTATISTVDLAFARSNEEILSAVSRTAANAPLASMLEAASRMT
jgi:hypothetical protein